MPELTDAEQLAAVAARFVGLRNDFLSGASVPRSFERFVAGGGARGWWVDGEAVLVTAHPDTPGQVPAPEPASLRDAVGAEPR